MTFPFMAETSWPITKLLSELAIAPLEQQEPLFRAFLLRFADVLWTKEAEDAVGEILEKHIEYDTPLTTEDAMFLTLQTMVPIGSPIFWEQGFKSIRAPWFWPHSLFGVMSFVQFQTRLPLLTHFFREYVEHLKYKQGEHWDASILLDPVVNACFKRFARFSESERAMLEDIYLRFVSVFPIEKYGLEQVAKEKTGNWPKGRHAERQSDNLLYSTQIPVYRKRLWTSRRVPRMDQMNLLY